MRRTKKLVVPYVAAAFAAVAGTAGACATGGGTTCGDSSDCEAGDVCILGRCEEDLEATGAGGGAQAATSSGGATTSTTTATTTTGPATTSTSGGGDGGMDATTGTGGGMVSPCATSDGQITIAEVPLTPGPASYLVALDTVFDALGTSMPGGLLQWDLAGPYSGETSASFDRIDPAGAWYAPVYPNATYVARLSGTSDLLGVYEVTQDALLLRGVVSPMDGFGRTELTYDPPVVALAFPISVGGTWSTTSTVTGLAQGIYAYYTETYTHEVDASGLVLTGAEDIASMRVKRTMVRTVGISDTTLHTQLYVGECGGVVAAAVSGENESDPIFASAAELRRLAP